MNLFMVLMTNTYKKKEKHGDSVITNFEGKKCQKKCAM